MHLCLTTRRKRQSRAIRHRDERRLGLAPIANKPPTSTTDGELSDELLVKTARQMSEKMANRVVDVFFPAKIIARTDGQVTINRGDGTGILADQIWDVFALGQELVDPDTGAVLGKEERKVGTIRVTSVLPLMAKAEVMEDKGIAQGQIVRPQTTGGK